MKNFKYHMNQKTQTGTLYLYEGIYWGFANDFRLVLQDLQNDGAEKFILRINSPGGSVYDGLAMFNLLKDLDVTVIIDGLAASAASLVAMAGKNVQIQETATMLVHGISTLVWGNKDDLEKAKIDVALLEEQIIKAYLSKIAIDEEALRDLMAQDRIMASEEALGKGFVDEILPLRKGISKLVENIQNYFNQAPPAPTNDSGGQMKQLLMSLIAVLAMAADATEDAVVAAVTAIRDENKVLRDKTQKLETDLDEAQTLNAELQGKLDAQVEQAEAEKAQILQQEAEKFADAVIADKKAKPADRERLIADHIANPEMAVRLYSLAAPLDMQRRPDARRHDSNSRVPQKALEAVLAAQR
jgi:ATP-dependent protease ClpP protease subunit